MYTIGQVAKFLGVSRDTLKFYEEKGLVRPMQDRENGYRYYNDFDIADVIATNFYRELDIEIKKIQEIREDKSIDELEKLFQLKKAQLEADIVYKQKLVERMGQMIVGCENIRSYLGKYTIREMKPLEVKGEIDEFGSNDAFEVLKASEENRKSAITLRQFREIIYFDEQGVTRQRSVVVHELAPGEMPEGEVLSHEKCIYTIEEQGRGTEHQGDISPIVEAFLRKVGKENGYEPVGRVYVNILLTTYKEGLERKFLEIYAPIL